jgi:signal peptide peptidase SppA
MSFASGTWALAPDALFELQRQASALLAVGERNLLAYQPPGEARPISQREPGGVAVVPVVGPLLKRPGVIEQILGAAATTAIENALAACVADRSVETIILEIDSPGGEVSASQGLANAVREAGKAKPVVAWVNGSACCSGALWAAAQASAIYSSTATATVGSIGVVARHLDVSAAHARAGVKVSEVVAGRFKAVASSSAPLSDEGRATLQAHVDSLYAEFLRDVGRGRGVPAETAAARWGDGRMWTASEAVKLGLVDGIASLADLIAGRRRAAATAGAPSALQALAAAIEEDATTWPAVLNTAAARVLADAGIDPLRPVPTLQAQELRRAAGTFARLRAKLGPL